MASAIDQFKSLQSASDFVFLVYFRGHWCPFCMSYLKDLQSIAEEMKFVKGTPIIVTAESQDKLSKTREQSGYQGEAIVDPENVLAKDLKLKGLLDVAISSHNAYPNGMAQPAVLVMRNDGTVLYQWAIVPGIMNLKGALDRPSLLEIWHDAQLQLNGKAQKEKKAYSTSRQSFMNVIWAKVFG